MILRCFAKDGKPEAVFTLKPGSNTVGRKGCDVTLDFIDLSKEHAKLSWCLLLSPKPQDSPSSRAEKKTLSLLPFYQLLRGALVRWWI